MAQNELTAASSVAGQIRALFTAVLQAALSPEPPYRQPGSGLNVMGQGRTVLCLHQGWDGDCDQSHCVTTDGSLPPSLPQFPFCQLY